MNLQNAEALDTGLGTDEANETSSQEAIANADNDSAEGSAPQDAPGSEDSDTGEAHQVPLNTYISERTKRQEAQKELEALRAVQAAEAEQLRRWEEARPEIEETYRKEQEYAALKARQEAEIVQLRKLAEENGLEVDMSSQEDRLLIQQLTQQVNSTPQMVRQELQAWQQEQARQQQEAARQQQEEQARRESLERFDREFDEATKVLPGLQTQKDTFMKMHEASNYSQSAKDLLTPIIGSMAGIAKAKEAKATLPNTQTGGSKETPEGNTRAFLPGETVSEYVKRQKALHGA